MVTSAILATTSAVALIPVVPVFVGLVTIIPSIINITFVKTNISKKIEKFKQLQKEYMNIITLIRLQIGCNKEWSQIAEFCGKISRK